MNEVSEKFDKEKAHRRHRRLSRLRLLAGADPLPHERETGNLWDFIKDGKRRFDPQDCPELMRK